MKNVMNIGCPVGRAVVVNFVLKFALLLLALVFFCRGLHAQCDGLRRGLDEFKTAYSCHRIDSSPNALAIDLSISGVTQASEILLTILSESCISRIDSIKLEQANLEANARAALQLAWQQSGSGTRLDLDLLLDGCNAIFQDAFVFRFVVFFAHPSQEDWHLSTRMGGIVQVDVIQAKIPAYETQRIYTFDGIMVREIDRPLQSNPATEGLPRGIYLLRRMQAEKVTRCEKVLVW